ncbi:amphoterin-induced protein 3 [Aplochiton taeniatus]
MRKTEWTNMTWGPFKATVLMLLGLQLSDGTCPSICLCTSDTVSCGSSGLTKLPVLLSSSSTTLDLSYNHLSWLGSNLFSRMPRLESLRLAHNQLPSLGHGVFHNASGLRQLDLSSNRLSVVERHYFQGLWRLEELLLFNNRITHVEGGALGGLSGLKKAYFSLNQITDFPFFSIQDHSHPFLSTLDLSSNRMTALPWDDVKALPASVQRGLFLHNNSLACDCSMYSVFWQWELRGFDSLKDFLDEHTCLLYGDPRAAVRFLRHGRFFQNCTLGKAVSLPMTVLVSSLAVYEGERVRLDCQTSLRGPELSFSWLTPSQQPLSPGTINVSLISLLPNGTMEIRAAKVSDSGVYVCTSLDLKHMLNATREVNVTVIPPAVESFGTGYTTLLGCSITLFFILVYLFLTPCRCSCCKQPLGPVTPIPTYDPETLTSIFSPSIGYRHQGQSCKHVGFIEPVLEEQNGCVKTLMASNQPTLQQEWDTTGLS